MWNSLPIVVAASLLLAFVQAPFQHVHEGDDHHGNERGLNHAHWDEDHEGEAALEEADHGSSAHLLDWLAGDGAAPLKFVPELPESVELPLPVQASNFFPELTPNNHDPPWQLSLQPRAPPA